MLLGCNLMPPFLKIPMSSIYIRCFYHCYNVSCIFPLLYSYMWGFDRSLLSALATSRVPWLFLSLHSCLGWSAVHSLVLPLCWKVFFLEWRPATGNFLKLAPILSRHPLHSSELFDIYVGVCTETGECLKALNELPKIDITVQQLIACDTNNEPT